MPFPSINPIAFQIGPLAIHWYGLAYVVGILGWWQYSLVLTKKFPLIDRKMVDDYLAWAIVGVILGGRLGYVLFYNPQKYWANPVEILQVWKGGMAFHGGLLGVVIATAIYTARRGILFLNFSDLACCGVPIGLFFGRIANFINGELYGRVTDASWGILFPLGGPFPRHPSQLYEAAFEGIFLFSLLAFGALFTRWPHRRGLLTGLFLSGYAVARISAECFREPDTFLGYFAGWFTMGQILSLPLLGFGLFLSVRAVLRKENA
ncbi:MAG: prolipoprotein diacylglyceryl transferase [Alphaproteobacteria bacterium]|nr:prolipoprotein diacylglyceryl transferase [Alphaproteobacteria bacterium]